MKITIKEKDGVWATKNINSANLNKILAKYECDFDITIILNNKDNTSDHSLTFTSICTASEKFFPTRGGGKPNARQRKERNAN